MKRHNHLHLSFWLKNLQLFLYRMFHDFRAELQDVISLVFVVKKSSYKHTSDFGRLQSYDRFKLRVEDKNYWQ
jgi:hypothetical protein